MDSSVNPLFQSKETKVNEIISYIEEIIETSLDKKNNKKIIRGLKILISALNMNINKNNFGVEVLLFELDQITSFFHEYFVNLKTEPSESYITYKLNELSDIVGSGSFVKLDHEKSLCLNVEYSSTKGTRLDSYYSDFERYMNVGEILKDDSITDQIISNISEMSSLRPSHDDPSIYAAIVGPSYMGKTQTAFTLAHRMNVIYVNFLGCTFGGWNIQGIYRYFSPLAGHFFSLIQHDINVIAKRMADTAELISELESKLHVLGFIYVLIRSKALQPAGSDPKEWMDKMARTGNIMFPPMTIREFKSKTTDINLNEHLIFIDELLNININSNSDTPKAILSVESIKFLRNLCRVVKIPVILSGTNSKVTNLIGNSRNFGSRSGENVINPWVKVFTTLPKSNLKSLGRAIIFSNKKNENENKNYSLSEFVTVENGLNHQKLALEVFQIEHTHPNYMSIMKIFEFLAEQTKTALPGILGLCFKILLESSIENGSKSSKQIWHQLIDTVVVTVKERKHGLVSNIGLLASAHILTFPSPTKVLIEANESFSAALVENHFYSYGKRQEDSFLISVGLKEVEEGKMVRALVRDGIFFKDRCYFPSFNDDFCINIISLSFWREFECKREKLRSPPARRLTLATLYKEYLDNLGSFKTSKESFISDSYALELLTHWSICHASHLSLSGESSGRKVFVEFVKNLQDFDNQNRETSALATISGLDNFPESLEVLLSKISVPFLLGGSNVDEALKLKVSPFMNVGWSEFPENKIGWDVLFDMNVETFDDQGQVTLNQSKGFIECKLWTSSIGFADFFKYYQKSCKSNHFLSFVVCNSLQESIAGPNAERNLELYVPSDKKGKGNVKKEGEEEEEEEGKEQEQEEEEEEKEEEESDSEIQNENIFSSSVIEAVEKASELPLRPQISVEESVLTAIQGISKAHYAASLPPKKSKKRKMINYRVLLKNMWSESTQNHINIYTLKYSQVNNNTKIDSKFTLRTLKTFPEPKGIFILVESNFKPPFRTSHS